MVTDQQIVDELQGFYDRLVPLRGKDAIGMALASLALDIASLRERIISRTPATLPRLGWG